jgi:hypothetical protein
MWYPYKPVGHGSGIIYWPLIEFEIIVPSKPPFITLGLVDSGADRSLLDIGIADYLELPVRNYPTDISGVGGISVAYDYPVSVRFSNVSFELKASWKQCTDPTTGAVLMPNLLGREDFFETFKVQFDQRKKGMNIIRYQNKK